MAVEIDGSHWVGLLYNIGAYIVYCCHPIAHLVSEQWVTRLLQSAFRHPQAQPYLLNGDCSLSPFALSSKHGQFSPFYPSSSAQFSWAISVTLQLLCGDAWSQNSCDLYSVLLNKDPCRLGALNYCYQTLLWSCVSGRYCWRTKEVGKIEFFTPLF